MFLEFTRCSLSYLFFWVRSKNVFGVSVESMQCSIDSHGNMVPTILLLLQKQLYDQQGLKVCSISKFWLSIHSCYMFTQSVYFSLVPPATDQLSFYQVCSVLF